MPAWFSRFGRQRPLSLFARLGRQRSTAVSEPRMKLTSEPSGVSFMKMNDVAAPQHLLPGVHRGVPPGAGRAGTGAPDEGPRSLRAAGRLLRRGGKAGAPGPLRGQDGCQGPGDLRAAPRRPVSRHRRHGGTRHWRRPGRRLLLRHRHRGPGEPIRGRVHEPGLHARHGHARRCWPSSSAPSWPTR